MRDTKLAITTSCIISVYIVLTVTAPWADSTRPGRPLDESIQRLIFLQSHPDPHDTCRELWGRLKRTLEEHTPPSLLCPPNRATWGSSAWASRPSSRQARSPGSIRSTWPVPGALVGPARPRARHPPPDWGGGDRAGGGPPDAGPALAHGRAGRDADAAVRPEQPPVRAEPDQRRARGQRGLLALHRARAGPGPAHHAPAALRAAEVLAWRVDCPPGPPRAILYRGHSTEVNLAARARTP